VSPQVGVRWVPLFELLERRGFEVYLVDPRQTKHVPGLPKSDVLDCQWIQCLHSYGLSIAAEVRAGAQEIVPLRQKMQTLGVVLRRPKLFRLRELLRRTRALRQWA
jgi:hypothetical protein